MEETEVMEGEVVEIQIDTAFAAGAAEEGDGEDGQAHALHDGDGDGLRPGDEDDRRPVEGEGHGGRRHHDRQGVGHASPSSAGPSRRRATTTPWALDALRAVPRGRAAEAQGGGAQRSACTRST